MSTMITESNTFSFTNVTHTIGVIADTHIPDRVRNLHPSVIPALEDAKVDLIFHAGDVSTPTVIEELEQVAPVVLVRGNRDLLFLKTHPILQQLELAGQQVVLLHGHKGLLHYLLDKLRNIVCEYQLNLFIRRFLDSFPEADVIIFGHTHKPENLCVNGKLIFNPGSAGIGRPGLPPSIGFLQFTSDRQVRGEIIYLDKAYMESRLWIPE